MRKSILQKLIPSHDKNILHTKNRRKFPQSDKGHLQKPTVNSILNEERQDVFLLRSRCILLPLFFNIMLEVLVRTNKQENEREGIKIRNGVKLSVSAGDIVLHIGPQGIV